jgi:hypothetical protein
MRMRDYISVADAATKWNISIRRVRILCEQERIPGAYKIGNSWAIPTAAEKPADARIKSGKYIGSKEKYKKTKNDSNKQGDEEL